MRIADSLTAAVLTAAVLAASLAACRPTLRERIPGTWRSERGGMTLRFAEDGTFTSAGPAGELRGRYRVQEDGTMEMDFERRTAEVVVSVADGKLVFCQPSQRCDDFRKVE